MYSVIHCNYSFFNIVVFLFFFFFVFGYNYISMKATHKNESGILFLSTRMEKSEFTRININYVKIINTTSSHMDL